ncbi:CHAD domain-containing protein [Brachybacterium sp. YJGR34]|uniref:CHAD domain-containing protein n=1 Tax=Brachybacterium sp. YJGR34 TaxID=2059911 RepID=UPI000E09EB10|nr:CHAD domain-containing protein [Brachybacterium sp. YJGR34]
MTVEELPTEYVAQHAARALAGLRQLTLPPPTSDPPSADLVHDTRTSLRRLRAVVRASPDALEEPEAAARMLRAAAGPLGAVRDADVLAETLLPALDDVSLPRAVATAVRADLEDAVALEREEALAALVAAQNSLSEAAQLLERWSDDPPVPRPPFPARLLASLRSEVRARISAAQGEAAALHGARKAAKRWRYTAEWLEPIEPSAAQHLEQARDLQDLLGGVQDAVVAASFLRRWAVHGAGGPAGRAAAGALAARQEQRRTELTARAQGML